MMNPIFSSSKCFIAFFALAVSFPANSRAESQSLVFKTTFDDEPALAEFFVPKPAASWTVEDGAAISQGNGVSSVIAKSQATPDCKVEVDVTLLEDVEEGGFSGVSLGGVIFHVRPDGFRYAYHIQGDEKERSDQKRQIIEYGHASHWEITRRTMEEGGYAFVWSADGEVVADFVISQPIEGTPESFLLMANRIKTRFDNAALYELAPSK